MFKLHHGLLESSTFGADHVGDWNTNIAVEDLTEVSVLGQILDPANFNTWGIHWHNNFADAFVRAPFTAGSADQIAIVRISAE